MLRDYCAGSTSVKVACFDSRFDPFRRLAIPGVDEPLATWRPLHPEEDGLRVCLINFMCLLPIHMHDPNIIRTTPRPYLCRERDGGAIRRNGPSKCVFAYFMRRPTHHGNHPHAARRFSKVGVCQEPRAVWKP